MSRSAAPAADQLVKSHREILTRLADLRAAVATLNNAVAKLTPRVSRIDARFDAKIGELDTVIEELVRALMRRDREIATIGELLLQQTAIPLHRRLTWSERLEAETSVWLAQQEKKRRGREERKRGR
jgi:hypothetical protein